MVNRKILGALLLSTLGLQASSALAHDGRQYRHEFATYKTPDYGGDMASEALRYIGAGNITGRAGAWCAHFVNHIARLTGHATVPSGMAYAMRGIGTPTQPQRGAIAYNYRHTGIVLSVEGSTVTMVSGNNSHHRVGISHFPVSAFHYAWPRYNTQIASK